MDKRLSHSNIKESIIIKGEWSIAMNIARCDTADRRALKQVVVQQLDGDQRNGGGGHR